MTKSNRQQEAGGSEAGPDPGLAPRLQEFESAVREIGATGGRANPERTGARLGLTLLVAGSLVALAGMLWRRGDIGASGANDLLTEIVSAGNGAIFVALGLAIALVGGLVWLRNSLTRYLRHWLIRLIYEDRANTDRIVEELRRKRHE
ncbi:MAG: hypothetical protein J4F50_09500 [Acidimicrobiia bacterium]|nr:hypothetical protein [Acidimicrobiia bacterium]